MTFLTDKQTLDDLNILGKYSKNSLFSLFNVVKTRGGEKILDKLFQSLLDSPEEINERSRLFSFFQEGKYQFPITRKEFIEAERYLSHVEYPNKITAWLDTFRIQFLYRLGLEREYKLLQEGVIASIEILKKLMLFFQKIEACEGKNLYAENCKSIQDIIGDSRLSFLSKPISGKKIPLLRLVKYNYIMRCLLKKEMSKILDIIYDIDVNIAVARVAEERKFCYAHAEPKDKNVLSFQGVFHFAIKQAVDNDVELYQDKNVIFLTGANMAGKSTLMKAVGSATYLAHMGFPVPAKKMVFSIREGMFTSINVSDNLNMGYSHFYSEVLRVKSIAKEVASNKHLLVIFDELFKGTNVKDAYQATVAITNGFSQKQNSFFIISTHIMEAGEVLREKNDSIRFLFLPTRMKGVKPIYTYKLEEGITDDRHGMLIINNEKIIEIINGKK